MLPQVGPEATASVEAVVEGCCHFEVQWDWSHQSQMTAQLKLLNLLIPFENMCCAEHCACFNIQGDCHVSTLLSSLGHMPKAAACPSQCAVFSKRRCGCKGLSIQRAH